MAYKLLTTEQGVLKHLIAEGGEDWELSIGRAVKGSYNVRFSATKKLEEKGLVTRHHDLRGKDGMDDYRDVLVTITEEGRRVMQFQQPGEVEWPKPLDESLRYKSRVFVPGHFKAYTSWLTLVVIWITFLKTGRVSPTIGAGLIIIGSFLGDQATHLAQADHSAPPPTRLEQSMQQYRWAFTIAGIIIAATGVLIAIR